MLDERIRNKTWPQVAWWCHSSKWTAGTKAGLGKDDELGQISKVTFKNNNSIWVWDCCHLVYYWTPKQVVQRSCMRKKCKSIHMVPWSPMIYVICGTVFCYFWGKIWPYSKESPEILANIRNSSKFSSLCAWKVLLEEMSFKSIFKNKHKKCFHFLSNYWLWQRLLGIFQYLLFPSFIVIFRKLPIPSWLPWKTNTFPDRSTSWVRWLSSSQGNVKEGILCFPCLPSLKHCCNVYLTPSSISFPPSYWYDSFFGIRNWLWEWRTWQNQMEAPWYVF